MTKSTFDCPINYNVREVFTCKIYLSDSQGNPVANAPSDYFDMTLFLASIGVLSEKPVVTYQSGNIYTFKMALGVYATTYRLRVSTDDGLLRMTSKPTATSHDFVPNNQPTLDMLEWGNITIVCQPTFEVDMTPFTCDTYTFNFYGQPLNINVSYPTVLIDYGVTRDLVIKSEAVGTGVIRHTITPKTIKTYNIFLRVRVPWPQEAASNIYETYDAKTTVNVLPNIPQADLTKSTVRCPSQAILGSIFRCEMLLYTSTGARYVYQMTTVPTITVVPKNQVGPFSYWNTTSLSYWYSVEMSEDRSYDVSIASSLVTVAPVYDPSLPDRNNVISNCSLLLPNQNVTCYMNVVNYKCEPVNIPDYPSTRINLQINPSVGQTVYVVAVPSETLGLYIATYTPASADITFAGIYLTYQRGFDIRINIGAFRSSNTTATPIVIAGYVEPLGCGENRKPTHTPTPSPTNWPTGRPTQPPTARPFPTNNGPTNASPSSTVKVTITLQITGDVASFNLTRFKEEFASAFGLKFADVVVNIIISAKRETGFKVAITYSVSADNSLSNKATVTQKLDATIADTESPLRKMLDSSSAQVTKSEVQTETVSTTSTNVNSQAVNLITSTIGIITILLALILAV